MDKNIKFILDSLPFDLSEYFIKYTITEIRLRRGFPLKICKNSHYETVSGTLVTEKMLKEIFMRLCGYTVSVYRSQIADGFITLPGGHRVGIGGKFDTDNRIMTISRVLSMNIRFSSCIDYNLHPDLMNFTNGLLIAGPPHSGKTTLLKTICRNSEDNIVICDERNEFLSESFNCDRISGIPKTLAIAQAVRCMNPDIIICDEIGSRKEAEELLSFSNSGVRFVSTVHASEADRLYFKPNVKTLLDNNVFDKIAVLRKDKGKYYIREIMNV